MNLIVKEKQFGFAVRAFNGLSCFPSVRYFRDEEGKKTTRVDLLSFRVEEEGDIRQDDGGQWLDWVDGDPVDGWRSLAEMKPQIEALFSKALDFWIREDPR